MISKKDEISREIERLNRELERLEALPDFDALPNGTVLAVGIQFGRDNRWQARQYVGLKSGDRWSFTKGGPRDSDVSGVESWLTGPNRQVIAIEVIVQLEMFQVEVNLEDLLLASICERTWLAESASQVPTTRTGRW